MRGLDWKMDFKRFGSGAEARGIQSMITHGVSVDGWWKMAVVCCVAVTL